MRDTYVQVVVLSILPAYLKKKIYIYIFHRKSEGRYLKKNRKESGVKKSHSNHKSISDDRAPGVQTFRTVVVLADNFGAEYFLLLLPQQQLLQLLQLLQQDHPSEVASSSVDFVPPREQTSHPWHDWVLVLLVLSFVLVVVVVVEVLALFSVALGVHERVLVLVSLRQQWVVHDQVVLCLVAHLSSAACPSVVLLHLVVEMLVLSLLVLPEQCAPKG